MSKLIEGAGGIGSGGTKKPRTPITSPDSAYLKSISFAQMQFLLCEGPIYGPRNGRSWNGLLASTYLDDTALSVRGFGGTVPVEDLVLSYGGYDQSPVPGYGVQWQTDGVNNSVKAGFPVFTTAMPSDPTTPHTARIVLTWEALLLAVKTTGDVLEAMVPYLVDYTDGNGVARIVFAGFCYGKFSGPFQREHEWNLEGPGPWTVRVVRMSADDPDLENSMASFRSAFSVSSLSYGPVVALSYRYSATLTLAARADRYSQLPAVAIDVYGKICWVPNNYDSWSAVYHGNWDGGFREDWTDNPAWCFFDMVRNPRYGLGENIEAALIDKWSLYAIAQYCDGLVPAAGGGTERRFRCNLILTSQEDAWVVLQQMASIFRGMVYWSAGLVTAIQDAPGQFLYTFNPSNVTQEVDEQGNVTEPCFEYQGTAKRTRHTVCLVSWDDPGNAYQPRVEYLADPEGLSRLGYRPLELRVNGITSRGQALRAAQWALLSEMLLDDTVTFGVGAIGLALRPGDLIKVMDPDRGGFRFGGRVASSVYSGTPGYWHVTLDAPPPVPTAGWAGATFSWQVADGLKTVAIPAVVGSLVVIYGADVPPAGAPWLIEVPSKTAQPFRIMGIEETARNRYTVTALRYREDIYNAVDFDTPLTDDENYLFKLLDPKPPTITTAQVIWDNSQTKLQIVWEPAQLETIIGGYDFNTSYHRLQYQRGEFGTDGVFRWSGQWQEVDRQTDTSEIIPITGYIAGATYRVRMSSVNKIGTESLWSNDVVATRLEHWFPMPDFDSMVPDATGALVPVGELTHSNRTDGGHRWAWVIRGQIPPYVRGVEVWAKPDAPAPQRVNDPEGLGPGTGGTVAPHPEARLLGAPDADGYHLLGTAPTNGTFDDVFPWPTGWSVRARLITFVPGLFGTSWLTNRVDRAEVVPPAPERFVVVTEVQVPSVAASRRFSWLMPASPFPGWPDAVVDDIDTFDVRFKAGRIPSWELGLPIFSDGIAGDQQWFSTTLFQRGAWTIMLRPKDRTGWHSDDMAIVTVNLGDPLVSNVVERIDIGQFNYPGALVNANREQHTSTLRYPPPTADAMYEPPLDDDFYDGSNGARLVQIDPTTDAFYSYPLTVTAGGAGILVYTTADATYQWFIKRDSSALTLRYPDPTDQAMYDGPMSGLFHVNPLMPAGADFHPLADFERLDAGTYTLAVQFKSVDGIKPAVIYDVDVVLDVPDRVETFEDLLVPAAGLRVKINPPMRFLRAVNLSLQAAPGATAVRVEVSGKSGSGFDLRAYDAAGAPAVALVDAVAQGG